jgi:hypothetical protein
VLGQHAEQHEAHKVLEDDKTSLGVSGVRSAEVITTMRELGCTISS